jgi:hypothetical protein
MGAQSRGSIHYVVALTIHGVCKSGTAGSIGVAKSFQESTGQRAVDATAQQWIELQLSEARHQPRARSTIPTKAEADQSQNCIEAYTRYAKYETCRG